MKTQFSILIFATALCFVACHETNEPSTTVQQPTHLIPFAKGNSWTYSRTDYDTLGNVRSTYPYPTKMLYDTVVGGVVWHAMLDVDLIVWYRDSTAGVIMYPPNKLVYKYPATSQDSFQYAFGPQYLKVISTTERVQVSAGVFSCYTYLWKSEPTDYWREYDYVCPGVGVIKKETYRASQTGEHLPWSISELSSYSVK